MHKYSYDRTASGDTDSATAQNVSMYICSVIQCKQANCSGIELLLVVHISNISGSYSGHVTLESKLGNDILAKFSVLLSVRH